MNNFEIWGWDKKDRTMIRFIKAGDVFCFLNDKNTYCFGRIVSKVSIGNVAEIFDFVSLTPDIKINEIEESKRLIDLVILDSYSLFDKKIEGDWRIIGRQKDFSPTEFENIYFAYGVGDSCRKVDIFDHEVPITELEAKGLQDYSPLGNYDINDMIKDKL
ncbi:phosphotriesterase [Lysinibacillus mangiferihumi]|uniref:Phosphotriesterase n=2 Tax=Lysinibacillus mangiferihumi TaxID=1130819 RepID=A0A4U2YLJ7_9BACI|nr:phosphotriesterase [Lysinibacillus mangiferihumi]